MDNTHQLQFGSVLLITPLTVFSLAWEVIVTASGIAFP